MGATPEVYVQGQDMQAPTPRTYPFSSQVDEFRGARTSVALLATAVVLLTVEPALAPGELLHVLVTGFYRGATKQGIISGVCGVGRLASAAAAAGTFAGGCIAVNGTVPTLPFTLVPVAGGVELRVDATDLSEALSVQAFAHVCRQLPPA